MKKTFLNLSFLLFTFLCLILSIWGPELFAKHQDKAILDEVWTQPVDIIGEGYRYTLNINEKLYILSQGLNSQVFPESEQSAMTQNEEDSYQGLTGNYAFIVNHMGPSDKEITDEQIYEICNKGIAALKELGVLPAAVKEVDAETYDAILYSAIDVLEPRNNVVVWKISLANSQKNANKDNRLIDAYIDADTGKLYEFYVRTPLLWEDIDPEQMIRKWSTYLELQEPVPYETVNPLMEITPFFKKYEFAGMGEEKTIATLGFFEGINELFIKISQ